MAGHLVPPAEGRRPGHDRRVVGRQARAMDPRHHQGMVRARARSPVPARPIDRPGLLYRLACGGWRVDPVKAELGPSAWQVDVADWLPPAPMAARASRPVRLGDGVFLARTIVGRAARRLVRSAAHRAERGGGSGGGHGGGNGHGKKDNRPKPVAPGPSPAPTPAPTLTRGAARRSSRSGPRPGCHVLASLRRARRMEAQSEAIVHSGCRASVEGRRVTRPSRDDSRISSPVRDEAP